MSTANPIASSGFQDNNEFSNRIALAALILGGGAFIVAFLQTILQYVTSGVREKCLTGAIGDWSKYTQTRWDVLRWRIRVRYAKYDLNILKALESRDNTTRKGLEGMSGFAAYIFRNPDVGFRDISRVDNSHKLRWWHVWYRTTCLVRRGNPVAIRELPLKLALRVLWFLVIHTGSRSLKTARASWVNMLVCINAVPNDASFLGRERADVIPSELDVPLQKTSLHNIGLWCFALGMKNVTVNEEEGTIKGQSSSGQLFSKPSIIPGLGNVISLEGDLETLRWLAGQPQTGELVEVVHKANGYIDFVAFRAHPYMFEPSRIVYGLLKRWTSEMWTLYRVLQAGTVGAVRGNLIWEAEQWANASVDKEPEWTAFWQDLGIGSCPSLLQTFAFLPYHSIWSGFPITAYLGPYLSKMETQRENWWKAGGQDICSPDDVVGLAIVNGTIPFLRTGNPFLLITSDVAQTNGARTWLSHPCLERLRQWNAKIYEVVIANENPLPIPRMVYRLLSGEKLESLRHEATEERIRLLRSHSLESSIWFAIYILEARVLHIWCQIEPDGTFGNLNRQFDEVRTQAADRNDSDVMRLILLLEDQGQYWLTSRLAEFLGLWLDMSGTAKESSANPFDVIDVVQGCFDRVLDSWKSADEPSLLGLPDEELCRIMNSNNAPSLGLKSEFFKWTEEGERRQNLRKLVPLLQLRAFLIYYSLLCCGDSSAVANLEFNDVKVLVA